MNLHLNPQCFALCLSHKIPSYVYSLCANNLYYRTHKPVAHKIFKAYLNYVGEMTLFISHIQRGSRLFGLTAVFHREESI